MITPASMPIGSSQLKQTPINFTNKNMLIEPDESSNSRERKLMFKIKKVNENAFPTPVRRPLVIRKNNFI